MILGDRRFLETEGMFLQTEYLAARSAAWETQVNLGEDGLGIHGSTWRIIPGRKWFGSPIYKLSKRLFGRGRIPVGGQKLIMLINHLLNGMILQADNLNL